MLKIGKRHLHFMKQERQYLTLQSHCNFITPWIWSRMTRLQEEEQWEPVLWHNCLFLPWRLAKLKTVQGFFHVFLVRVMPCSKSLSIDRMASYFCLVCTQNLSQEVTALQQNSKSQWNLVMCKICKPMQSNGRFCSCPEYGGVESQMRVATFIFVLL